MFLDENTILQNEETSQKILTVPPEASRVHRPLPINLQFPEMPVFVYAEMSQA